MKYMKYIVTDPCYLLSGENWQKYCSLITPCMDKADAYLSEVLETEAKSCETGVGDWTCVIEGYKDNILSSRFVADAGMVCFCRLTPKVFEMLEKNLGDSPVFYHLFAVIEIETANPKCEFESVKGVTLLTIRDGDKFYKSRCINF